MAKRKPWSKVVKESGVTIRLYERSGGIYRSFVVGRVVSRNGIARSVQDRKPLGHSNRKLAEEQAKALAKALADQRALGGPLTGPLTVGQLREIYVRECGALLSDVRMGEVRKAFRLFARHLGEDYRVADMGPHQVTTYAAARQGGTLTPAKGRHIARKGVRVGTIAKELGVLHAALNWASTFRLHGVPLIAANPLRGVPIPSEPNPSRPVATRERFDRMIEHADAIDGAGRFRLMLLVAWYTGRRLNSIVNLRASDLLLTPELVERGLSDAGMDAHHAEHWPAAVRWAAESDKEGVDWIVPIPESLRAALAEYIRARAMVGGALLFHASRDRAKPLPKETAFYWLRRAEQLAGLPHQTRGGWHALRRAWATARKHMPLQDVMAAGGWRDATSLQRAYQHADARTVRAVMDLGS